MQKLTDQLERVIHFKSQPKRIVSLVPSLTELLYDLHLDQEVVGITKFCVHPIKWRKEKNIIGGTKNPRLDDIISLSPDLVIANKEENNQEDIEYLSKKTQVYVSKIADLEDCYHCILDLGRIFREEKRALKIVENIKSEFRTLPHFNSTISFAYCIWKDPYMFAGSDTFIHHMASCSGMSNVIKSKRYPELTISELVRLSPDYLFLSSEPYPFKQQHVKELQQQLPYCRVLLVDGEMFSWYGSRIKLFPQYLNSLDIKA